MKWPRTNWRMNRGEGLLAKCRAFCSGEENRANAQYVQLRVKEMQDEILEQQIREAEAKGAKPSYAIRVLRGRFVSRHQNKSRRWRNNYLLQ